jgi:hypothetical protein
VGDAEEHDRFEAFEHASPGGLGGESVAGGAHHAPDLFIDEDLVGDREVGDARREAVAGAACEHPP